MVSTVQSEHLEWDNDEAASRDSARSSKAFCNKVQSTKEREETLKNAAVKYGTQSKTASLRGDPAEVEGLEFDLELRSVVRITLGAVAVLVLLVAIGDYNTNPEYAGPKPRQDDGGSILLNTAAGLKSMWFWLTRGTRDDEL
jgi:hypothetical protein